MFNILPLLIILFCLVVIIFIVVRKFSVLANLDVDTIPAEREAKIKEQIISNRLKRNIVRFYKKAGQATAPAAKSIALLGREAYRRLSEYREKRLQEEEIAQTGEEEVLEKKFHDIDEAIKSENWVEAEKKCIEAISLDPANVSAFHLLGQVYENKKEYQESIQALEHALRLLEKDHSQEMAAGGPESGLPARISQIYYDLACVSRRRGRNQDALAYLESALRSEPNNPKILDIKLQISIIEKDKIKAYEALQKLKEVNPQNAKLPEYDDQVREL